MKNRKGPENCILNKNSFWAGGDTTVAGAHTTAGKNRQLPGTITVPGLVTTKPITNWLTLDQFSCQYLHFAAPTFMRRDGDEACHTLASKLNVQ